MATNLEILIQTCVELGSAKTLETLGLSSGEISQRKARDVYGKYFMDAELSPEDVGQSSTGLWTSSHSRHQMQPGQN